MARTRSQTAAAGDPGRRSPAALRLAAPTGDELGLGEARVSGEGAAPGEAEGEGDGDGKGEGDGEGDGDGGGAGGEGVGSGVVGGLGGATTIRVPQS